jgi:hypothetical protein
MPTVRGELIEAMRPPHRGDETRGTTIDGLGECDGGVFTVFCGSLEPKIGGAPHRRSWS